MNTYTYFLFFMLGALGLFSCTKEPYDISPPAIIELNIEHHVDGIPLVMDSMLFTHPEGQKYSVSKLKYYLSNVVLIRDNGTRELLKKQMLVDVRADSLMHRFILKSNGSYSGLEFTFGLYEHINHHDSLEAISDHLKMIWPEQMGGGYHFMKLEGHFARSDSTTKGYAMHLGENGYQFQVRFNQNFSLHNSTRRLDLNMNINEWFKSPDIYSFSKDGSYSMGIPSNMLKLRNNGKDAFTLRTY